MKNSMIPLTGGHGQPLHEPDQMYEPEVDSVVLSRGEHGLAWQRLIRDGLWHAVGSNHRVRTWDEMLGDRDVVLIYEAKPREPEHRKPRAAQITVPASACPDWCTTPGTRHQHPVVQR